MALLNFQDFLLARDCVHFRYLVSYPADPGRRYSPRCYALVVFSGNGSMLRSLCASAAAAAAELVAHQFIFQAMWVIPQIITANHLGLLGCMGVSCQDIREYTAGTALHFDLSLQSTFDGLIWRIMSLAGHLVEPTLHCGFAFARVLC